MSAASLCRLYSSATTNLLSSRLKDVDEIALELPDAMVEEEKEDEATIGATIPPAAAPPSTIIFDDAAENEDAMLPALVAAVAASTL